MTDQIGKNSTPSQSQNHKKDSQANSSISNDRSSTFQIEQVKVYHAYISDSEINSISIENNSQKYSDENDHDRKKQKVNSRFFKQQQSSLLRKKQTELFKPIQSIDSKFDFASELDWADNCATKSGQDIKGVYADINRYSTYNLDKNPIIHRFKQKTMEVQEDLYQKKPSDISFINKFDSEELGSVMSWKPYDKRLNSEERAIEELEEHVNKGVSVELRHLLELKRKRSFKALEKFKKYNKKVKERHKL